MTGTATGRAGRSARARGGGLWEGIEAIFAAAPRLQASSVMILKCNFCSIKRNSGIDFAQSL